MAEINPNAPVVSPVTPTATTPVAPKPVNEQNGNPALDNVVSGAPSAVPNPFVSQPSDKTPGMTKDQELNLAYQRISNGQATAADNQNINYAVSKGWAPSTQSPAKTNSESVPPSGNSSIPGAPTSPAQGATTPDNQNQPSTDYNARDKVAGALNNGHTTPEDVAAATGLTLDQVNSTINSNQELGEIIQKNQVIQQYQPALDAAQKAMESLNNGTYQLTPDEQAQVNALQAQFAQAKQEMIQANTSQQNTEMLNMNRSGLLESTNGQVMSQYSDTVTKNIQKVSNFDSQAASAIATLKQALEDNDYKKAAQAYKLAGDAMDQKTKAINDTADATRKMYDRIAANNKAAQDSINTKLNQEKITQEISKNNLSNYAPAISDALTGDNTKDATILDQWAKALGTDSASIFGAIQNYTAKTPETAEEKSLISKGYTETTAITPGAVKVGDKYYSAPEKYTTKVVGSAKTGWKTITYDSKGNIIKTESATSPNGGGGGTPPQVFNVKKATPEMEDALMSSKGQEGYVSKEDWDYFMNKWSKAGGTRKSFISTFSKYSNPAAGYDYTGIKKVATPKTPKTK